MAAKAEIDRVANSVARQYRLDPAELANEFWVKNLSRTEALQITGGSIPNLPSQLHGCAKDFLRREPVNRLRRKTLRNPVPERQGITVRCCNTGPSLVPMIDLANEANAFDQVEARLSIDEALLRLDTGDSELIRMRCLQKMSCQEIAAYTGRSPEQIKTQIRRRFPVCFARLQKELS